MVEIFKLIPVIDLKEVQKVSLKCHELTSDLIFSKFQTSDFLATSKGFCKINRMIHTYDSVW